MLQTLNMRLNVERHPAAIGSAGHMTPRFSGTKIRSSVLALCFFVSFLQQCTVSANPSTHVSRQANLESALQEKKYYVTRSDKRVTNNKVSVWSFRVIDINRKRNQIALI